MLCSLSYFGEWLSSKCKTCGVGEKICLPATIKSHGDDLGRQYLWNGEEYSSLENSLKAVEKNAEYAGQPDILALVHVIERPITVHYEGSDRSTVFG